MEGELPDNPDQSADLSLVESQSEEDRSLEEALAAIDAELQAIGIDLQDVDARGPSVAMGDAQTQAQSADLIDHGRGSCEEDRSIQMETAAVLADLEFGSSTRQTGTMGSEGAASAPSVDLRVRELAKREKRLEERTSKLSAVAALLAVITTEYSSRRRGRKPRSLKRINGADHDKLASPSTWTFVASDPAFADSPLQLPPEDLDAASGSMPDECSGLATSEIVPVEPGGLAIAETGEITSERKQAEQNTPERRAVRPGGLFSAAHIDLAQDIARRLRSLGMFRKNTQPNACDEQPQHQIINQQSASRASQSQPQIARRSRFRSQSPDQCLVHTHCTLRFRPRTREPASIESCSTHRQSIPGFELESDGLFPPRPNVRRSGRRGANYGEFIDFCSESSYEKITESE